MKNYSTKLKEFRERIKRLFHLNEGNILKSGNINIFWNCCEKSMGKRHVELFSKGRRTLDGKEIANVSNERFASCFVEEAETAENYQANAKNPRSH